MLDSIGLQTIDEVLSGFAERLARGGRYVPVENTCRIGITGGDINKAHFLATQALLSGSAGDLAQRPLASS